MTVKPEHMVEVWLCLRGNVFKRKCVLQCVHAFLLLVVPLRMASRRRFKPQYFLPWAASLSQKDTFCPLFEDIFSAGMADTGVELDRLVAPVPQNPDEQQKDDKLAQTLLFVLLTVVLYGIAAEAFFINLLYHRELVSISSVYSSLSLLSSLIVTLEV